MADAQPSKDLKSNMISEKVLVVEDTKSVSMFMRAKIEAELHFQTIPAYTFKEARNILENDSNFFIAVLDLNLPDAPNGEIVDFVLSRQIPAIILTATLDDDVRDRILSRNVVDYVVKQSIWSVEYVTRLINRVYRNQSIKVLVTDDSSSFRLYYRSLLEAQRYQVLDAADGELALQVLQQHPDIKLIITDYNMPNMDGFELVARVRKKYSKDQLAIIGLSTQASGVLSAKFLKLGVNDFLKKPFVVEELYARVTQNIEMIELICELKEAANRDPLTRLFNRRYCLQAGRALFEEATKTGPHFAIGMIDIDFFKKINDVYGHDAGDAALKYLAVLLQDATGSSSVVGRFGGEEFCVLAAGVNRKDAEALFEHTRQRVEQSEINYMGKCIKFTISTGVATSLGLSLEAMIKRSDEMLYIAKRGGRNCVIMEPED